MIAPNFTNRHLNRRNSGLTPHSKTILVTVLLAIGAVMTGNGLFGLISEPRTGHD
jgi:hypothetical protein